MDLNLICDKHKISEMENVKSLKILLQDSSLKINLTAFITYLDIDHYKNTQYQWMLCIIHTITKIKTNLTYIACLDFMEPNY